MSTEPSTGTLDMPAFRAHLRRRWWFVVAQALVITVAVVAVIGIRNPSSYGRTVHFVLHPASTLSEDQVPAAVDGLRPDGSLLQTVLHVLSSDQLSRSAARAAHASPAADYVIDSTVQTGSAFFDVRVTGPDREVVANVAKQLETAAPATIDSLYRGYSLNVTGIDTSDHKAFPPSLDVLVLALMLGAALGVGFTFVEWWWAQSRPPHETEPQPFLEEARSEPESEPELEPELEPSLEETWPEPEPEPELQLQPNGRGRPPGTNGKSGRASQPKGTPGAWSDAKRKPTPGPAATSSKKDVRARSERGSSLGAQPERLRDQ